MDSSGSAFPYEDTVRYSNEYLSPGDKYIVPGLTKREWFAGMALSGIIANINSRPKNVDATFASKQAYRFADGMIAAGKEE